MREMETKKFSKKGLPALKEVEEIIRMEAKACTRKYLMADSVEYLFFLLIMSGIKAKRLISRPNQAINQEFAETVTRTEALRRKIKTIEAG